MAIQKILIIHTFRKSPESIEDKRKKKTGNAENIFENMNDFTGMMEKTFSSMSLNVTHICGQMIL